MQEPHSHRQALHLVVAHRHFLAVATLHLAADLQNILDFVRDLDCSILDWRLEESIRVVLGCYWQNMAEGERRYIELVRDLAVLPQLPNQYRGRASDHGCDVGVQ